MKRKIKCNSCGKKCLKSHNFCPHCGSEINNASDDKLNEFVEVPKHIKRSNLIFIFVSVIYTICLFLPLMFTPVMDAGPIATTPIVLAIMFLGAIGRIDPLVFITMILSISVVIITAIFLISSIKNVKRCRNGEDPLFGRSIFCLVVIPVIYSLIIAIFGMIYDCRAIALVAGGFLLVLLTFAISLIFIIVRSVDKSRVSILGKVAVIVAVISLIVICVCVFQPVFKVEAPNGFDGIAIFEFSVGDFEDFYDSNSIQRYYKNIAEKGALKVMSDAARRVQNSGDRGEALADVMMVNSSVALPIAMLISILVIVLSASMILASLLTKLCTARGKSPSLAISKVALLISAAAFIWSIAEVSLAITEIGNTLEPLLGMTFSLMAYPVVTIVASIVMLILQIKVKKED